MPSQQSSSGATLSVMTCAASLFAVHLLFSSLLSGAKNAKDKAGYRDGHRILSRSERLRTVPKPPEGPLSVQQLWDLRERTRKLWFHAYDSYIDNAAPWDELMPLSCAPRKWNERGRGTLDDTLGGFSLTAVDSLQALAVLGAPTRFLNAVGRLSGAGPVLPDKHPGDANLAELSFDRDVDVSVFETTIRVLGGMLAAKATLDQPFMQQWAADHGVTSERMDQLSGSLLSKVRDLSGRLLRAYPGASSGGVGRGGGGEGKPRASDGSRSRSRSKPKGQGHVLPFHKVNLRRGLTAALRKDRETCVAAAGTALLEFALAGHYLGDPALQEAAMGPVREILRRRGVSGLPGSTIDSVTGALKSPTTGVGAGVDSFLEYLLKGAVMLGSDELMGAWRDVSAAVDKHLLVDLHVSRSVSDQLEACERRSARLIGGGARSSAHGGGPYPEPARTVAAGRPALSVHREAMHATGGPAPRPKAISALQAFYPGLLVLDGRVEQAWALLRPLLALWAEYGAIPDVWDGANSKPVHFARDAPLRPELIESMFFVWSASQPVFCAGTGRSSGSGGHCSTAGDSIVQWAAAMLSMIEKTQKVGCGLAAMADVETQRLDDRMDSFVLSETLKYMFWLFDEALKRREIQRQHHVITTPTSGTPSRANSTVPTARVAVV